MSVKWPHDRVLVFLPPLDGPFPLLFPLFLVRYPSPLALPAFFLSLLVRAPEDPMSTRCPRGTGAPAACYLVAAPLPSTQTHRPTPLLQ